MMPQSIHFICRKLANGQATNVDPVPGTSTFSSGYWDIKHEDAEMLVGGWLYPHETKKTVSYRGGRILSFKHEIRKNVVREDRISLFFHPKIEAISISWRGYQHQKAWTSGLINGVLPHEREFQPAERNKSIFYER